MAKKIASNQTTYGSQSGSTFVVNDSSGTSVLSISDGSTDVKFSGGMILTDKEQEEEWVLSVSKGKIVLTPNNKKAIRRHKLNELLDEDE